MARVRGIKQPHPLGSVPGRSGISLLTVPANWLREQPPSARWRVGRTGSVIRITEIHGPRLSEAGETRLTEDGQERATETILMQSRRRTTDGRTRIIECVNVGPWIKTPAPANTWSRAYA